MKRPAKKVNNKPAYFDEQDNKIRDLEQQNNLLKEENKHLLEENDTQDCHLRMQCLLSALGYIQDKGKHTSVYDAHLPLAKQFYDFVKTGEIPKDHPENENQTLNLTVKGN